MGVRKVSTVSESIRPISSTKSDAHNSTAISVHSMKRLILFDFHKKCRHYSRNFVMQSAIRLSLAVPGTADIYPKAEGE